MGGTISKGPRIPRDLAKPYIHDIMARGSLKWWTRCEPAGSYRREKPDVGDIEFVVISELGDALAIYLSDWGVDIRMRGAQRISGIWKGVQLDFDITNEQQWGAAMLYFTGSKEFNVKLRGYAKSKGFLLNQKGLWERVDENPTANERTMPPVCLVASRTEEDIFKALRLVWIHPRDRTADVKLEQYGADRAPDPHRYDYVAESESEPGEKYNVMVWDDNDVTYTTCTCAHYTYRLAQLGGYCKHIKKILAGAHPKLKAERHTVSPEQAQAIKDFKEKHKL